MSFKRNSLPLGAVINKGGTYPERLLLHNSLSMLFYTLKLCTLTRESQGLSHKVAVFPVCYTVTEAISK